MSFSYRVNGDRSEAQRGNGEERSDEIRTLDPTETLQALITLGFDPLAYIAAAQERLRASPSYQLYRLFQHSPLSVEVSRHAGDKLMVESRHPKLAEQIQELGYQIVDQSTFSYGRHLAYHRTIVAVPEGTYEELRGIYLDEGDYPVDLNDEEYTLKFREKMSYESRISA